MKLALEGKMEKFCEEYIVDYNPIRAAIRAGYSSSCAKSYSYQLLKKEKEELVPLKKRNEELSEFKKSYPEVDERNLDPEILKIWEETGRPLKDIYNEITLKKLLNEKNAKKANEENKNASSGSALGVPEREEEFTEDMIRNM